MERLGDLSDWTTSRLEGDRYLVEARDMGAWFDGPTPEPAVQAAARTDFAGVILRADFMEQNPIYQDVGTRIATAASRGTIFGGKG